MRDIFYYDIESQKYISIKTIVNEYKEFKTEEENFSDYLKNCLFENNGSLMSLERRKTRLVKELNKFLSFEDTDKTELETIGDELTKIHRLQTVQKTINAINDFTEMIFCMKNPDEKLMNTMLDICMNISNVGSEILND